MTGAAASSKSEDKSKGKFRDNVDAFAIAILMAILMKFFAIEAYQIPTSSMQPTMMGHKASGVFDRIIVDKLRYELVENPERWDIVVFRYPIRTKQNYVKRLVGLPGEKLRIAGGNIYKVKEGGDSQNPKDLTPARRPESVQNVHWKELYPARHELHGERKILGRAFRGSSAGKWTETDDGTISVERMASSGATLTFANELDGGLMNQVYDGYALDIQRKMLEEADSVAPEGVQDARISFTLEPTETPDGLSVELEIRRMDQQKFTFQLAASAGKARLEVEVDNRVVLASDPFDLALADGSSTHVAFCHLDDQCQVWIDGDLVQTLGTEDYKTLEPLHRSPQGTTGKAILRIVAKGSGKVSFTDLRVERDLHYVPSSRPGNHSTAPIDIEPGKYLMLGDNTLQSVDSRDWTAMTIGTTEDGKLIDPRTVDENKGDRLLTGNMRAISLHDEPDPDENPLVVVSRGKVVFTDEIGEVWVLDGKVSSDPSRAYGPGDPWFEGPEGPWQPPTTKYQFVKREHIIGRPVLNFWPWYRIGFIR